MNTPKLLVVDDEPSIRRLLHGALGRAGFDVLEAGKARDALAVADIDKPDAVLLDLGLPDRDGMELVPLMKAKGIAVLIISVRDATTEKVTALDLGADDYVTKPFDTDEVLARVRTALRHRDRGTAADTPILQVGDVEIDLDRRQIRRQGEPVHLRPKEYSFVAELARTPGRVVTHAQLLRTIWGPAHANDLDYLRVAARGVRKKLETDPAAPSLIINEPAVGYRLSLPIV
jgi:two-component system KDP operon response regulator KdpE